MRIDRTCEQCGTAFQVEAWVLNQPGYGRLCSQSCQRRNESEISRQARVMCTCQECGATFNVPPSAVKRGHGRFCSRSCLGRHNGRLSKPALPLEELKARRAIRNARRSVDEPMWLPEEWIALKIKYDYRCLMCGKQEPEITLTVDHVIPKSKGGANKIDNLQPLCKSCNTRKHSRILDLRR